MTGCRQDLAYLHDVGHSRFASGAAPELLAILLQRSLTASLLRAELPACDAVTSFAECVNDCFDPNSTRGELIRLFRRIYAAVRSGGVFIFDIVEPAQFSAAIPPRAYRLGHNWVVLRNSERIGDERY